MENNLRKIWMMIISIIVSIAGVALLYYLNQYLAVQINTQAIPVVREYIPAYTTITTENYNQFISTKITPKLAISEEAFLSKEEILGKTSTIPLGKGGQLLYWKLDSQGLVPKENERIFALPEKYFYTHPNTLKRGDLITIYKKGESIPILEGIKVVYARQASNSEVVQKREESTGILLGTSNQLHLDNERLFLSGPIDELELFLSPEQWERLEPELLEHNLAIAYKTVYKEEE